MSQAREREEASQPLSTKDSPAHESSRLLLSVDTPVI